MSIDPSTACDLFVFVATGTAGLVLGAAAVCRMLNRPRWQRLAWLVCVAASACLLALELTGAAAGLVALRAKSLAPSSRSPSVAAPLPGVVSSLVRSAATEPAAAAADPAERMPHGCGARCDHQPLGGGWLDGSGVTNEWPAWAVFTWLVVAGVLLGRLVVRHAVLMAFVVKHGRSLRHPLADRIAVIAGRLGLRRPVAVLESDCIDAPIALGVFKPTIGLPAGFTMRFTPLEQDVMLAHELAHVAGRDPNWRLIADVLAACVWWQPCVWWMGGRLAAASEAVADEASRLRADGPHALAACLVRLAREGLRHRQLGWLGVDGSRFRSGLGRRVERLLAVVEGPWRPPQWRRERLLTSLAAIASVAVMLVFTAGARSQPPISGGSFMERIDSSWQRSVFGAVVCAALAGQVQAEPVPGKASQAVEAAPAGATRTQAAGPATAVAVVDLGAVFKNHVGFQAAMEKLKNEVMASEITLGAEQDRIKGLMKQLKGFDSGTAEYKKLEADVATAVGDWSVTARLQKEAFYARQFQLHGQFYAEIEKAVEQYARANRITAVLRDKKVAAALRQPKAAPADNVGREQIREWIQNPVVYVAPVEAGRHDSSDITPEIIALVNGTAGR